jgi:hypothetical protein
LAEEFGHNPDPSNGVFSPAYYLFTLGGVSDGIIDDCTERGVQFFYLTVEINNNRVKIGTIVQKKSEGVPYTFPMLVYL